MKQTGKPLNPKQQRFCEEYIVDMNATQAAIRAGYSEKTAHVQASDLLKKPEVQTHINALRSAQSKRVNITADYVLSNLTEVIERSMQRAPVMVREGREMVQLVDDEGRHVWQFNANGANKALELLGKHLKLFTEKHEVTGKDGRPIEVRDLSALTDEQIDARLKELEGRKK